MISKSRHFITCIVLAAFVVPSAAEDRLLTDAVEFTGAVLFLGHDVPGLVIGAVRNGETTVAGFGKTGADGGTPGGDTMLRIGSISKVFTTLTLAHLVAEGTVRLTDPVDRHLDWDLDIPAKDGNAIRLIDLATHASGLPRDIDAPEGPPEQPHAFHTEEHFIANLKGDPLMFAPGTGVYYSNFAFDVLSSALADAADKPYDELLSDRVLGPIGLTATTFEPTAEQRQDLMQGHGFDGEPLVNTKTPPGTYGSGGLYSTTNDMLRWLKWHLDRFGAAGAEARTLNHAIYLHRDNLNPVYGMDESGHMDAMSLGWVVMQPSRQGTGRSFCRKLAGCRVFSPTSPLHRCGTSACSSPSINMISRSRWVWPKRSTRWSNSWHRADGPHIISPPIRRLYADAAVQERTDQAHL